MAEKSASGFSFKLDLPTELGRVYLTFQVSRLNLYRKSRQDREVLETYKSFELQLEHKPVKKVLAKRTRSCVKEVWVHKADSDPTEAQWSATSSVQL